MKTRPLVAFLGVAILVSAEAFSQARDTSQVVDIARVMRVSKGGLCEACPDDHEDQRRPLSENAHIKSNDWVHCLGLAKGKAIYLAEDGTDKADGEFELAGDDWEPVPLPGAPDVPQPGRPRLSIVGSNQGITRSTDPQLAAEVEQRAQARQYQQQASALPTYQYAEVKQERSANRALRAKVRTALARDKGVSVKNIEVRARGGRVVLHGSVPEHSQAERATDVAKGVSGVTSVRNALTIRPSGPE